MVMSRPSVAGSERAIVGLAGADAHRMFEAEHKDFAVADLAGLCRADDGIGDLFHLIARNRDLDLQLGKEVRGVFGTAINLGMTLLASVAFDLRYSESVNARPGESIADFVEFEWFDDRRDEFH